MIKNDDLVVSSDLYAILPRMSFFQCDSAPNVTLFWGLRGLGWVKYLLRKSLDPYRVMPFGEFVCVTEGFFLEIVFLLQAKSRRPGGFDDPSLMENNHSTSLKIEIWISLIFRIR